MNDVRVTVRERMEMWLQGRAHFEIDGRHGWVALLDHADLVAEADRIMRDALALLPPEGA